MSEPDITNPASVGDFSEGCTGYPAPQADDGWQLVPRKATAEMCSKGADAFFSPMPETIEDENARAGSIYRRMLAASPPPPAQADDGKDALIRELVWALWAVVTDEDELGYAHDALTRAKEAGYIIKLEKRNDGKNL